MKPIYLTPEDKEEMLQEFRAQLNKTHLFDGAFSFTRKFYFDPKTAGPKARVLYTPMAYVKMLKLIQEFASEIAWHGLVKRGETEGDFIVYDIITHEQTVTGSTVTTEDEQYARFLEGLTDEQADNMFLQAHSHVNYGVTPSGTDIAHQTKIVQHMSTRKNKGFQIFQIWNKSLKCSSFVYDFANNIYYEDKDVIVDILFDPQEDYLATNFVNDAKKLVVTKTTAAKTTAQNITNLPAATQQPAKHDPHVAPKSTGKKGTKPLEKNQRGNIPWWERDEYDDVDFDEEFFARQNAAYEGYNGYNGYDYGYN